jgi:hypothetical protein
LEDDGSIDPKSRVDPLVLFRIDGFVRLNEKVDLWIFKVPVSVNRLWGIFILITIHQAHKTNSVASRFQKICKSDAHAGWVSEVFTLAYLPGRIFVFGPAKTISGVGLLVGIQSRPTLIPRAEWGYDQDFLPWIDRDIPPQSWVRISKGGLRYAGDLGYVLGSARDTDALLIAVVPRIRQSLQEHEIFTRERKQRGKRRKREVFGPKATRLPPTLFDPDTISVRFGQNAVEAVPLAEEEDFINAFADKYAYRVVTQDPNTKERVVSRVPLNLDSFDWANSPIPQENVYQFDDHLFYRGLLILPIYSYGAVEKIEVPPVDEVIPFAESGIDPLRINRLLSQLHWQAGDHVSRADALYELVDIQLELGTVSAFEVQYSRIEMRTMGSIPLPLNELQRKFMSGDGVIVVAGSHKGLTGLVLREGDGICHVLADDLGNSVSRVNCSVSSIADVDLV